MTIAYWTTRFGNGLRKVAAGLTPFGESVWPGVRNDLFVAHLSIYNFFATFVPGNCVLDAGAGTGYGSALLADAGARSVTAVDIDHRSVRYAARHYIRPNLRFLVADCQRLDFPPGSFDLAFSSNVLEHLLDPAAFLRRLGQLLAPHGFCLIALPPITTQADLQANHGIHYHRTNLMLADWPEIFVNCGWLPELWAHRLDDTGAPLDFSSPFPSSLTPGHFQFTRASVHELYSCPAITAVFLLKRPA